MRQWPLFRFTAVRGFSAGVLIVVLSACAIGPDYRAPAAPGDDAYRISDQTAGYSTPAGKDRARQQFIRAGQVRADWYRLFGSEKLDHLIGVALAGSPTLAAGKARLKAAQESVAASRGALFPQVNASAGAQRERSSGVERGMDDPIMAEVFNLYQGQISASYDLDIFGKNRRQLEKSRAQFDAQRYTLLNTYVTLVNNVVAGALAEAGLNASIQATQRIADAQQKTLDTVQQQIRGGIAIEADAAQIRTQLAQTWATLQPLYKQRAIAVNRLAVLTGSPPGRFVDPQFDLADLTLPTHLPVSLPGKLVRHRPDVLTAAAEVHAASAQIGVATANLLPDLSISASYSRAGLNIGDLGDPANALYSVGASLAAPIFAGGRLRAQKRAAQDQYVAALADYRATALAAFGDVANSLQALESDARTLDDRAAALAAARTSLQTTQSQFTNGTADGVGLYTAEDQYQSALLAYTNARMTRYTDSADLFRALGGGWWNRDDTALALNTPASANH